MDIIENITDSMAKAKFETTCFVKTVGWKNIAYCASAATLIGGGMVISYKLGYRDGVKDGAKAVLEIFRRHGVWI
jgi:hypothetical protein